VRSAHLRSASEYWSQNLLEHDGSVNVFPARELVLLQQLMERQNDLCSAWDWRLLALGAGSEREDGHKLIPCKAMAKA
jgi:hypothetical protein